MIINYELLHTDVLKKINRLGLSQSSICEKIDISRTTIFRISKKKNMSLKTYLTLTDWLEKDLEYYIVRYKRPVYIQKRLGQMRLPPIKK